MAVIRTGNCGRVARMCMCLPAGGEAGGRSRWVADSDKQPLRLGVDRIVGEYGRREGAGKELCRVQQPSI